MREDIIFIDVNVPAYFLHCRFACSFTPPSLCGHILEGKFCLVGGRYASQGIIMASVQRFGFFGKICLTTMGTWIFRQG